MLKDEIILIYVLNKMLNYKGLRKRQTYDNILDYLEHHQEIITYPNRVATNRMNDNINNEEYEQLKK